MSLLTIFDRLQLPPIGYQKDDEEPVIFIHYLVPNSPQHWYVSAGSPVADDFVFFGFHIGSEFEEDWDWKEFRLSDLEAFGSDGGARVIRDNDFQTGRFTDVVPHPDLSRDFSK